MNTTVSNCRCGELTINAPQSVIDQVMQDADFKSIAAVRRVKKPVRGLGVPVLNFSPPGKQQQQPQPAPVKNKRKDGKPTPLGIPSLTFAK